MTTTPEEIVGNIKEIASLPTIFMRLSDTIRNPRATASDIGKIISEDPGLTFRILKLVNSALFGFPAKIDTVSRAVIMIGTAQLHQLALATSVVSLFQNLSQHIIDMDSFWRHSIACGVLSRAIANAHHAENIERFFVAGLLHDIGNLPLYIKMPEQANKILYRCKSEQNLKYKIELEELGFDHAHLGKSLLALWNLPSNLIEAVGFHHNPAYAKNHFLETAIVHIADIMANALNLGSSGERLLPKLTPAAWDFLQLDLSQIKHILDVAKVHYHAVVKIVLKKHH